MIVVGYSADRHGRAALDHAIDEARRRDTTLLVVNVTAGTSYVDRHFASDDEMADVERRLATCGVRSEFRRLIGSDPVAAVLEATEHEDAEMLVIGLRPRHPLSTLLVGSTASELLRACRLPVVAVKADPT